MLGDVERILELKHVPYVIDGERYYGGGVDEEITLAITAFKEGNLDEAERWCICAEARSLHRYDDDFNPMRPTYYTPRAPTVGLTSLFIGRKSGKSNPFAEYAAQFYEDDK